MYCLTGDFRASRAGIADARRAGPPIAAKVEPSPAPAAVAPAAVAPAAVAPAAVVPAAAAVPPAPSKPAVPAAPAKANLPAANAAKVPEIIGIVVY